MRWKFKVSLTARQVYMSPRHDTTFNTSTGPLSSHEMADIEAPSLHQYRRYQKSFVRLLIKFVMGVKNNLVLSKYR